MKRKSMCESITSAAKSIVSLPFNAIRYTVENPVAALTYALLAQTYLISRSALGVGRQAAGPSAVSLFKAASFYSMLPTVSAECLHTGFYFTITYTSGAKGCSGPYSSYDDARKAMRVINQDNVKSVGNPEYRSEGDDMCCSSAGW